MAPWPAGSSPHVRGTYAHYEQAGVPIRFIPARAGNMPPLSRPRRTQPVHPRTCGEHSGCFAAIARMAGSSPHVRGTFNGSRNETDRARFIPARAGNIARCMPRAVPDAVHPRTCGEHTRIMNRRAFPSGSSPHVRGTCRRFRALVGHSRFIPARAGNIPDASPPSPGWPVHPRTCGEHLTAAETKRIERGSSPHVRGTLPDVCRVQFRMRFIPARAGNIRTPSTTRPRTSVHPRTCGEHGKRNICTKVSYGSSPHVRGTFLASIRPPLILRFIPARAGNILLLLPRNHGTISGAGNLPNKTLKYTC